MCYTVYTVQCIHNTENGIYDRNICMNVNHIKRKIDIEKNTIQKYASNKLCCNELIIYKAFRYKAIS